MGRRHFLLDSKLHSNGDETVASLEHLADCLLDNSITLQTFLASIQSHLDDAFAHDDIFEPHTLQTFSACFLAMAYVFSHREFQIIFSAKNKATFSTFWPNFQQCIVKFWTLTLAHDRANLESRTIPSGLHDGWDIAGWIALLLANFAATPEYRADMMTKSFQVIVIRLCVQGRAFSRPRFEAESEFENLLSIIVDLRWTNNDLIFSETVDRYPEEFKHECYRRVVERVQSPKFGQDGQDNWPACFKFIQDLMIHSKPIRTHFLGHGIFFWMTYAFNRHLASQPDSVGRTGIYVKYFPLFLLAVIQIFKEMPTWICQGLNAELLQIIYKSSSCLQEIRPADSGVERLLIRSLKALTASLIHRNVLRCTRRWLRRLRRKNGVIENAFDGELHDTWISFLQYAQSFEDFSVYIKDAGLDYSDCSSPECSRTQLTYVKLQCSRCERAYYCSPACQKVHYKFHRQNCWRDYHARLSGTFTHSDHRQRIFVSTHAGYAMKQTDFSDASAQFLVANPMTPPEHIIAHISYLDGPPTLRAGGDALTYVSPETVVNSTELQASTGGGHLAHIIFPCTHKRPEAVDTFLHPQ